MQHSLATNRDRSVRATMTAPSTVSARIIVASATLLGAMWTAACCRRGRPEVGCGYQRRGYWPNGTAKTSSWGGNILHSATGGGWEAFVAEIPRGLANWQHESRCIYATSPNCSGPFVKAGVALPAECHNPQVLREHETGDYLLFHLGARDPETGRSIWLSRSKSAGGPFLPANTSTVHCGSFDQHITERQFVGNLQPQPDHIPPGDEATA